MEENKDQKPEIKFEDADVICQSCVGQQIETQIQHKTLFSFRYYVRWCYVCNVCGKQSKVFLTKSGKQK